MPKLNLNFMEVQKKSKFIIILFIVIFFILGFLLGKVSNKGGLCHKGKAKQCEKSHFKKGGEHCHYKKGKKESYHVEVEKTKKGDTVRIEKRIKRKE